MAELIVVLDVEEAGDAAHAGANFVVLGRPILEHGNAAVAVGLIEEELG